MEDGATDVVCVNASPGENGHCATFPEDLIRPRILSSCPPRGVVLDPFCGSGRSLKVSVESGRHPIGFDIVSNYVEAVRATLNSIIAGV